MERNANVGEHLVWRKGPAILRVDFLTIIFRIHVIDYEASVRGSVVLRLPLILHQLIDEGLLVLARLDCQSFPVVDTTRQVLQLDRVCETEHHQQLADVS